jgi:hypothetical protein
MCDLDLEARYPNVGSDTPISHDTRINEVSSNYLQRIRNYGPDKNNFSKNVLLTSMCDIELEARDPNVGRDTPPCHETRINDVSSNYLQRVRSYGPDKNDF